MLSTLIKIFIGLLFSLCLFSCHIDMPKQINGKGEVKKETQIIKEKFDRIAVSNGWDVHLESSLNPSLQIEANENLLEILEYKVENGTLKISSKRNINEADAKKITVYYPKALAFIKASSGAGIFSTGKISRKELTIQASSGSEIKLPLKTETTEVKASSGANVELSGTSINLEVKASSGALINAKELKSKKCNAKASSGANLSVNVLEKLTAKSSSGAAISYYGKPKSVSVKEGVSGNIKEK